ncbi:MAG: Na+/H+ antiporter NhaC family protein [Actinomycetota bacterium]|nr:Na+/H+ antiporter NhaC family protein [Actinomycetota bacterium]
MENSVLSLLPPIVTIGLAIATKRIFLALGIGVALGTLMLNDWSIGGAISQVFEFAGGLIYAEGALTEEVYILFFILMLGVLTTYTSLLGGARAFTAWATARVKSRFQAQLLPIFMGILIFFDDAFSSLVAGNVSRPLTDKYRVSRAKLSYLVDSTAAPVIILTPISGWAAFISTVLAGIMVDANFDGYSGYEAFLRTIPANFYAITALVFVFAVAYFGLNLGPMRKHEERAVEGGALYDASKGSVPGEASSDLPSRSDGRIGDLVWPVVTLIGVTVILSLGLGVTRTDGSVTAMQILANTDVIFSLAVAVVAATLVALAKVLMRKTSGELVTKATVEGIKSMLPAAAVLFLAWITAEIMGELGVGEYLGGLIDGTVLLSLLPAIFFVLSAFMSFSIGSTFGTFGVMLPIGGEIAAAGDPSLLIPVFAAVLAGSIFGDHSSPLSDTTILSAIGSGIHLMDHVTTQLPYALVCALASTIGYVVLGFTKSTAIGLATALASLGVLILLLKGRFSDKELHGSRVEREASMA